jgi:hypothetical protein
MVLLVFVWMSGQERRFSSGQGRKMGGPQAARKIGGNCPAARRMQTEKSLGDELLRPVAWDNCHLPRLATRAARNGLARIGK